MILVIDVGNINMTIGVYEGKTLRATFRMMTRTPRTSDEYGVLITQLLADRGIKKEALEGSIVASVVPDVMHSLMGALVRYTGTRPMKVGPGTKTGIRIITEDPRAIGADRMVDAVAAYEKYGGPVLVLDFGTATTYDLINERGEFAAGITAPASASVRRRFGPRRRSCRRSRSGSRSPFWLRRPSAVCRRGLCTGRSARRNISSKR